MNVLEMAKQYVEIIKRQLSDEEEKIARSREMVKEHEAFIVELHTKLASGLGQIKAAEEAEKSKKINKNGS